MKTYIEKKWIQTGIICGFLTMIIYPSILFISFPLNITLLLAFAFGILLLIASIGLYHILGLHNKSMTLQLGVLFNIIGCSVVTMMFTIQIALISLKEKAAPDITREIKNYIWQMPNTIQLGLDIVWDIFFGLGTFLIALNMFNHPRFGKIISIIGMAIALLLLVLNIATFPIPPGEAGSFDAGPLIALWYLVTVIMTARSLGWVDSVINITSKGFTGKAI
ncbi:MAG: DUF4386 family protein [Ignavibacteriae bacterium]|nr:MAG: DUF4386 family protein [Ignavibacteriota bacterium]